jgi:hypothetical protein
MDFRNEIQLFFLLFNTYWFTIILSLQTISTNHFIIALISELNKIDENISEDNIIAPWEVTKWLVLSSFIFGLPSSIYGLYNSVYRLSIILIVASIISANHWKLALHKSWRRNLDLIFAKITLFILFIYNIFYIRTTLHKILVYVLLIPALYCFYLSNTIYVQNSPCTKWRNCHFIFHMLCSCLGLLFMYNVVRYSKYSN